MLQDPESKDITMKCTYCNNQYPKESLITVQKRKYCTECFNILFSDGENKMLPKKETEQETEKEPEIMVPTEEDIKFLEGMSICW